MQDNTDHSMGDLPTQKGAGRSDISMGEQPTRRPDAGSSAGHVDRYALIEKMGQGGFGAVYRAHDEEAGVEVALKALPPQISHSPEELDGVRRNFALVSKLVHSHIANVRHLHRVEQADPEARAAMGVEPGDYLVVMECVQGSTLSSWRHIFPDGNVPVSQALEVCRQVAAALDFAHGQKIIHRDIKPSNVMVGFEKPETGNVKPEGVSGFSIKVLDFGLAAEIRSSMSRVSQEHGDTSGTRPYMAPEQWAGSRQGAFTDQYALAVLFYELVSGEVPYVSAFQSGDPVAMLNAVQNQMPEPLAALSKQQNAVLLRALAKDPADRFECCSDFTDALAGEKSRKGSGRFVAAVLVIGLLLVGLFAVRMYNPVVPEPYVGPAPVVDSGRQDAVYQRGLAEAAQKSAKEAKADSLAAEDWRQGLDAALRAGQAFETENYKPASSHWKTAAEHFQRSEVNARSSTLASIGRISYLRELKRLKGALSVDELSHYDEDKLSEAMRLADEAQQFENTKQWDAAAAAYRVATEALREAFQKQARSQVDTQLEKAQAAKRSDDWNEVYDAASSAFSQLEAEMHIIEREQLMKDAAALKAEAEQKQK
jgi:hypothetical protein